MAANPFIYPAFRPRKTDLCFCDSGELFGWCCGSEDPDRDPPHGVTIVSAFLDEERCRRWVAALESRPRSRSRVYDHQKSTTRGLRKRVGSGRTSEYLEVGELQDRLNQEVARAFRHASGILGRRIEWFELPRVLRYAPGQHYGTHADNCHREPHENFWTKKADRDISLLIYLNRDFEGGSLRFEKFNWDYHPAVGDLVLFPSDNRYKHGALPVQSGLRYVIVSWGALEGEPRVFPRPPGFALPMSAFPPDTKEIA